MTPTRIQNLLLIVTTAVPLIVASPALGDPARYVNPLVGTQSIGDNGNGPVDFALLREFKPGNTFPGAVMPWGMISVSPHTFDSGYVGSQAGYYPTEKHLYGFGMNHISGAGCPDLGNCRITATSGELHFKPEKTRSTFSAEKAEPGYYAAELTTFGLKAEATCSSRGGMMRFHQKDSGKPLNILIDASHLLSWCAERWGRIRILSDSEFEVVSEFGNLCQNFGKFRNRPVPCDAASRRKVYFYGKFSEPATEFGTTRDHAATNLSEEEGEQVGAYYRFLSTSATITLKIGISYTSNQNARINLEKELPDWNFARVRNEARSAWNDQLSTISVKGGSEADRTTFYSALYHCLIHPNIFEDVNGQHAGYESNQIKLAEDYERHALFSLWDTYRTLHPLLTLAYPQRQSDMNTSIVEMYRERGRLPKWEMNGRETGTMAGDPVIPVLVDSYLKGIRNLDIETAYQAMLQSASIPDLSDRQALDDYLRLGYVPHDSGTGSVSKTIDYGYSDWLLARLAQYLGKSAEANAMERQSIGYRQLVDPQDGFIKPRLADGSWLQPFDPMSGTGYVEGNAWHYTFTAFHDLPWYIDATGGQDTLEHRLDRTFSEAIHSWLIQPNQPDMNYPFLFTLFESSAWRTQHYVDLLRTKNFGPGADGLFGNDDAGTFSSWFVFSAIGLYPLVLGSNEYVICNPLFEEISIQLDSRYYPGGKFTVRANQLSSRNIYIQSIKLNGRPHFTFTLRHEDVVEGGLLELEMGPTPIRSLLEAEGNP